MASVPPPQGMNEADYETIEAAVTETVRGRWFLSEFARRNRMVETRQLLDAMARLEAAVAAAPPALPSADPSIRLLIQRIKEIAGQLGSVASDMRQAGVDERFVEAVGTQMRAVSGMMRSATAGGPALTPSPPRLPDATRLPDPPKAVPAPAVPAPAVPPRMPRAELPAELMTRAPEALPPRANAGADARLTALAEIDALPLSRKLALFT